MLKMEMRLDVKRMLADGKYSPESIYATVDKFFVKHRFRKEELPDGTICYQGNGLPSDYGVFGRIITSLKDKEWFMAYLVKWLWYNSDDGETENDYTVEDVLYHYTRKKSAA